MQIIHVEPLLSARLVFAFGSDNTLEIDWKAVQDLKLFGQTLEVIFTISTDNDLSITRKVLIKLTLPLDPPIQAQEIEVEDT